MTAIILVWDPDEWNDWTYPAVLEEVLGGGPEAAGFQPVEDGRDEGLVEDDEPAGGDVARNGDEDLAAVHGDCGGVEGGDLVGAQACRDEGEEGGVAQADTPAETQALGIDAGEDGVGVLGADAHQKGSGPAGVWKEVVAPLQDQHVSREG